MSRAYTWIRVLAVLACAFSAAGADRYRVTLVLYPGDDAGSIAKRLAAAYRGQLETPVDESGTFMVTLSSATADLLARDPQVARVVAPDAATTWATGNYEYDGAGNIAKIGTNVYVYDDESRLVREKAGAQTRQALTYDGFGNILSITEGSTAYTVGARSSSNRADIPSSATNHLSGTYDGAGNMIASGVNTYTYDALNVMTRSTTDVARAYVYNANDERIGIITLTPTGAEAGSQWTVRDPAGQVLRRFSRQGNDWRWMQDYIYRDGKMLASESNDQLRTLHYHLDHLGTPRLITGNGGTEVARHTYYPFGEEVPGVTPQVAEPKKFTGHERDSGGLDYMHARYYDFGMGRFLSVDPTWLSADLGRPQSWNRYAYVVNNPINLVDPTGKVWMLTGHADAIRQMQDVANSGLFGQELAVTNGTAALVSNGVQGPPTQQQQALADTLGAVINDTATTTTAVVSDHPSFFIGKSIDKNGTMASPQTIDAGDMARIGPGPATTGAAILGHEVHEQFAMQTKGAGYGAAHAAGILRENAIAGSTRLDATASSAVSGNTITFTVRYQQNGGVIPFRIQASLVNGLITGVAPRP